MLQQLSRYNHYFKFRYSSFLVHLILQQNPGFFSSHLSLSIFNVLGLYKPVSVWNHVLSRTWDYYAFGNYFLQSILQDLSQRPLHRLSPKGLEWIKNHQALIDYFMGVDLNFIRCHRFTEESFLFPKFVIDKTLALEVCHQETILDNGYGAKRNKKQIHAIPLTIIKAK